ncbi:MAG: hypothetical protein QM739_08825 [Propionivibrio sp.]
MTRTTARIRPIAVVCAAFCLMAGAAHADITLISFGGTNQKAQEKAFYQPYTKFHRQEDRRRRVQRRAGEDQGDGRSQERLLGRRRGRVARAGARLRGRSV